VYVHGVVVTFAISSADEFLVIFLKTMVDRHLGLFLRSKY